MLNCLLFTDHMFAPREGSSRREEEGELAEVTRCNVSDSYNKEYASQHSNLFCLFLLICSMTTKWGGYCGFINVLY